MVIKRIYNIISKTKFANNIFTFIVKMMISVQFIKIITNLIYNKFNYFQKKAFYALFSKALVNKNINVKSSNWEVYFCNKKILMPLRSDYINLDWDLAVSIIGHDLDVVKSYETLIKNSMVNCFFDIGTNYGTHSLLFLSQGIETISFEPNTKCNEYFFEACKTNNFNQNMNNIGIGNKKEVAFLKFPKNALWNGSFSSDVTKEFENDVETIEVNVETLDLFANEKNLKPALIKIDTEGFELNVFMGAKETINKNRPIIIFECNFPKDRKQIYKLLEEVGFIVCKLPISDTLTVEKYNCESFETSKNTNFLALDIKHNKIKII